MVVETLPTPTITDFLLSSQGIMMMFFVVMIIVIITLFFKFYKKAPQKFKGVPLDSVLKSQINSIIKISALKGKWGTLNKDYKMIARIRKAGEINFLALNPDYKPPKNKIELDNIMKDETKQKYIEKRMLIFKISFNLRLIWPYILSRLLDLFNINNKYAIVEREKIKDIVIEKNGIAKTYWNIDVKTPVYYFGNIYLYGYYPLQYVTKDLAWTYGREKELEELVNYAKKIVFMEGQHAKGIDTLEEIQELEAKKYKDKLGSFGAS